MDQYFARMKSFANKEELPSRIRFMLQDVEELRKNGVRDIWFANHCNHWNPTSQFINILHFCFVLSHRNLTKKRSSFDNLNAVMYYISIFMFQLYYWIKAYQIFGYNATVSHFQWKPRYINRDTGPRTITEIRKEAADVSHQSFNHNENNKRKIYSIWCSDIECVIDFVFLSTLYRYIDNRN